MNKLKHSAVKMFSRGLVQFQVQLMTTPWTKISRGQCPRKKRSAAPNRSEPNHIQPRVGLVSSNQEKARKLLDTGLFACVRGPSGTSAAVLTLAVLWLQASRRRRTAGAAAARCAAAAVAAPRQRQGPRRAAAAANPNPSTAPRSSRSPTSSSGTARSPSRRNEVVHSPLTDKVQTQSSMGKNKCSVWDIFTVKPRN